ncbi:MAG TPA: glycine zipper 2TM domain-containing protein [Myxococcota bacterium]|nr:glycine zipper 2TM domain-containing protein [Myxococcota bacterium]
MPKLRYLAAASMALAVAACGSDPYRYSEPRYAPATNYYGNGAYSDVGRVVAIDVVRGGERTSGGGAIAGGVVGGILGHQIGSGRGQDAATVAGAIGGALAGNEIERRRGGDEYYRVTVQFRDGREATFSQDSLDGIRVGDPVRVANNRLYLD